MRYGTQHAASLMAAPNLAPLVDVLLVLLALVITALPMAQATGLLALHQRTSCPPWPASSPSRPTCASTRRGDVLEWPAARRCRVAAAPGAGAADAAAASPLVHLATADDTDYEDMARVLLAVSQHGLRVDAPGQRLHRQVPLMSCGGSRRALTQPASKWRAVNSTVRF